MTGVKPLVANEGEVGSFDGTPSGLAKEIRYLRENNIKTAKMKDGSIINLDDIDLTFLTWE